MGHLGVLKLVVVLLLRLPARASVVRNGSRPARDRVLGFVQVLAMLVSLDLPCARQPRKWEDYDLQRLPLLDACGAHIGPTPESSTPVYHYHVQDQAPFTVGCHGPSQSGGLVSVALCRSLYSDCDDDGGG